MRGRLLLFSLCCMLKFAAIPAQKTPTAQCSNGDIRLDGTEVNSTCGSVVGKVEICTDGSWLSVYEEDWTQRNAVVACRQLGYSTKGANISHITLTVGHESIAPTTPVCQGSELTISSCRNNTTTVGSGAINVGAIKCFNSSNLCSDDSAFTDANTTPMDVSVEPTTLPITSPVTTSTSQGPTTDPPPTTSFLKTPLGLGVVSAVIVLVITVVIVVFVVVLLVVCRRSPVNKMEQSRISPHGLENSLKDTSENKDKDGVYEQPVFNNSPDRVRHPSSGNQSPEHHNIYLDHDHLGPIYEHVRDVPPASVSSQESGGSSTEPSNDSVPTYSTLDQSTSDYAQLHPCINGSLTRGASLQNGSEESHYHVLNRSISQGSGNTTSSSPTKSRAFKPYSSPKQSPKTLLPPISDVDLLPAGPMYAILEPHSEVNSEVSNSAVVSHRNREQKYAVLESPQHQRLTHSNSLSGRPVTHEQVTPRLKSSTLPHMNRSGPSYPTANGVSTHPHDHHDRWSGFLDSRELPNGLETSRLSTYSNNTDPDKYPANTWV